MVLTGLPGSPNSPLCPTGPMGPCWELEKVMHLMIYISGNKTSIH